MREIVEMEATLKDYILEVIEVEKTGLEVNYKQHREIIIPKELQNKFYEIPVLETAFEALTLGQHRVYILYFSQPKTRTSRVVNYMQQILNGKGLND